MGALERRLCSGGALQWCGTVVSGGRLRPRRYELTLGGGEARVGGMLGGVEMRFDGALVAVGNCPSYGGGLRICPDTDPADVLVAQPWPGRNRGTRRTDPKVIVYRARRVRIGAEDIIGYADGERIGLLPPSVDRVPGAVRLLR